MSEYVMAYYKEDKMIQSTMKLAISSCLFLTDMVDQIQELGKFQMNLFKIDYVYFNFREKILKWLGNAIIQAGLKCLKFELEIDMDVPNNILSDPDKIKNVLLNILNNSIKYT